MTAQAVIVSPHIRTLQTACGVFSMRMGRRLVNMMAEAHSARKKLETLLDFPLAYNFVACDLCRERMSEHQLPCISQTLLASSSGFHALPVKAASA